MATSTSGSGLGLNSLFKAGLTSEMAGGARSFTFKSVIKNNMVIFIGIVVLILLAGFGYKLSCSFMSSNNSALVLPKKAPEFNIITPQCVFGALKNSEHKVLVVNVLSDKMPIFIGVEGPDEERSISKASFETLLANNKGQIPTDVEMVILMCAGWSCGAAKSYFEDLVFRGVNIPKVVDYAGGIHEWCSYNRFNDSVFKVFNQRAPDNNNVVELSKAEILTLLRGTAHGYKTNTIVESKEAPFDKYCGMGTDLPNLLN